MELIAYIGIGYLVIGFTILHFVVRKAKRHAASCGHKWSDMWDDEKWIAYLKVIGCDIELEKKKEN